MSKIEWSFTCIGNLSYVFEDGCYWWQIVGYKGMAKDIKTYWQVLKEGKIKEVA